MNYYCHYITFRRPSERVVATEVLDASELITNLKEEGVFLENLAVAS